MGERNKIMTFRPKHTHETKKGYFEADCPACELILANNSTTGIVYGVNGRAVKDEWRRKRNSTVFPS